MQIEIKHSRRNQRCILQTIQNDYDLILHSNLNEKDRIHLMNQVRKQVDLLYKEYRYDMDLSRIYHTMLRKVNVTLEWLHEKRL